MHLCSCVILAVIPLSDFGVSVMCQFHKVNRVFLSCFIFQGICVSLVPFLLQYLIEFTSDTIRACDVIISSVCLIDMSLIRFSISSSLKFLSVCVCKGFVHVIIMFQLLLFQMLFFFLPYLSPSFETSVTHMFNLLIFSKRF